LKKNIDVIFEMTSKQENLISQMDNLGGKQKDVNEMILKSLDEQKSLVQTQNELIRLQKENKVTIENIEKLTSETNKEMQINLDSQKIIKEDQEKLKGLQQNGIDSMGELKKLTSESAEKSNEIVSKQQKMVEFQETLEKNLEKLKNVHETQFHVANDSVNRLIQISGEQNQKIVDGNKQMISMKKDLDGFANSFETSINEALGKIKSNLKGVFGELSSNGESVKVLHHDMIGYFESFQKSCKIFPIS
jgi:hypothetical protein